MKKILVVVDMQNDFITGALGTPEAVAIVDKVCEKIRGEEWDTVYVTMDTHDEDYLKTQEGKKLPIKHCIESTEGWYLSEKIEKVTRSTKRRTIFKHTFGSRELVEYIMREDIQYYIDHKKCREMEFTLVGVCTDICVISNALLLKAHYPEMKIVVDASCCAGSTPFRHREALDILRSCQVEVVNDPMDELLNTCMASMQAVYGAYLDLSNNEPETFIDGAMDSPLLNKQNKDYTPTCPKGYSDCVCDPAYIKYHYPDWYKKLYGDMTPEEASKERCVLDDEYCYDDEDK